MEALLAIAVVFGSVGGPLLLSRLNAKQRAAELRIAAELRRDEKREDWARQDAVAARVDEVQRALKLSEASTTAHLEQIQAVSDATHTLVNSQATAAKVIELRGKEREVVLLKRVIALEPDHDDAKRELEETEVRVAELKDELAERLRNDYVANAQLDHDAPDPELAENQ